MQFVYSESVAIKKFKFSCIDRNVLVLGLYAVGQSVAKNGECHNLIEKEMFLNVNQRHRYDKCIDIFHHNERCYDLINVIGERDLVLPKK